MNQWDQTRFIGQWNTFGSDDHPVTAQEPFLPLGTLRNLELNIIQPFFGRIFKKHIQDVTNKAEKPGNDTLP